MRRAELAKRLIDAPDERERRRIAKDNVRLVDERLAAAIRAECYAAWAVDPVRAQRAAAAIKTVARINGSVEINASVFWINGIALITKGKFGAAAESLNAAAKTLLKAGRVTDAAQVQVARLLALAMLGRYDDALRTGQKALKIFAAGRDHLAAGKIEMNLSNIVSRRALHRKAEKYGLSARRRFKLAGEPSWLAMAENGLANTYAELNEFTKAERFYKSALALARTQKMLVTEAEIEASLGNLALLRGRYADALRFLETSRQKYDQIEMPHQSAIADLEIADIYLDLSLLKEAAEIYERITPVFRHLKLRAEEARSRLNHGQTARRIGATATAKRELTSALMLFRQENNVSGQVSALLASAELELGRRSISAAETAIDAASILLKRDDNPRHIIALKLLKGEAAGAAGELALAESTFLDSYKIAQKHGQLNSAQTALSSLGKLALKRGQTANAKAYLTKSIRLIEGLRSPLAGEEFSMSFLASRLEPYENLARLHLFAGKIAAAFEAVEQGRSRSLLDSMATVALRSGTSSRLDAHAAELRAELNFYYKQFDRVQPEDTARLRKDIGKTETKLADLNRRINSLSRTKGVSSRPAATRFHLKSLQAQLGDDKTLVEYIENDGRIAAFVVTGKSIKFVSDLGTMSGITELLEKLHFQFGTLRYGSAGLSRFMPQMKQRTDECLMLIYDQLLRPLEKHFGGNRLIIVPTGAVHYVPLHALNDGKNYVAEKFETTYTPSAAVWSALAKKVMKKPLSSLLVGYADERIPLVEKEIGAIKKVLPRSKTLVGGDATFSAFIESVSAFDLIHIACHGQFRPDNPMFSSLHLADGWVTVQDICSGRLKAGLVTLSACETGLSKIFAGEEILGLTRGFLAAGAASLVVSLWTVNDAATAQLMANFYKNLQRGLSPAASLRIVQREFIKRGEHPFLWAPFVVIGR